jgi:hypothetical protein
MVRGIFVIFIDVVIVVIAQPKTTTHSSFFHRQDPLVQALFGERYQNETRAHFFVFVQQVRCILK